MKIRLYLRPPGSAPTLLEVELTDEVDQHEGTTRLKCFSPPPGDPSDAAMWGAPRAWAVDLEEPDVTKVRSLASEIRPIPFGDAKPRGGGYPVELALTSGQAEVKLSWWMTAPTAWGSVQSLVTLLIDLSRREGDDIEAEDDEPEEEGVGKGLFGKLFGR